MAGDTEISENLFTLPQKGFVSDSIRAGTYVPLLSRCTESFISAGGQTLPQVPPTGSDCGSLRVRCDLTPPANSAPPANASLCLPVCGTCFWRMFCQCPGHLRTPPGLRSPPHVGIDPRDLQPFSLFHPAAQKLLPPVSSWRKSVLLPKETRRNVPGVVLGQVLIGETAARQTNTDKLDFKSGSARLNVQACWERALLRNRDVIRLHL